MPASDQLAFDFGPAAPRLIIKPASCSASAGHTRQLCARGRTVSRAIERPMRRRFWRVEINGSLDRPQGQEDKRARLFPRKFSVNTVKNMKFGGGFPKYRRKTSPPSSLNDVSLYLTVT